MTHATIAEQPQTMGAKIDELFELREQYRRLNKEAKAIKAEMDALEQSLLADLDEQDLRMSRGRTASVTVSEVDVPTIEDWEEVQNYILQNEALHLMERRVSSTAWRELYESGELVPGTRPYTRRTLSLRKV